MTAPQSCQRILHRLRAMLPILLLLQPGAATAEVDYRVSGLDERLRQNVERHLDAFVIGGQRRNPERIVADAIDRARLALRPYGYYEPTVDVTVENVGDGDYLVRLAVQQGPAVVVAGHDLEIVGSGKSDRELRRWRDDWPLTEGSVLDQTVWEEQKLLALETAKRRGYLGAKLTAHAVEIDLEAYTAQVRLQIDTGERYRVGAVTFSEHSLKPGIVEYIARFEPGDVYSQELLQTFRLDLWKSGYFTDVEIERRVRDDVSPPLVDLHANVRTESRNTYQGSIGYGTDTEARLQVQWTRQPVSQNGDRLDLGIGWQQKDDEISMRGSYRLPRANRARQFWIADLTLRDEAQDLEVKRTREDDAFIQLANGRVDEVHLRAGRQRVRNAKAGDRRAFETLFVQVLRGGRDLSPDPAIPDLVALFADPDASRRLLGTDNVYSLGIDYDKIAVVGKAWETHGYRDRAWLFASSSALGSEVDFTQAYLSTRRSYRYGDDLKLLWRAEIGYTDAAVAEFSIDVNGEPLDLSVTQLPNYYRFRAGGSRSVRGYGFEDLSDNLIGSNHIATASIEVERRILDNWSLAAFVDIGNAFNDWDTVDLKKGVGLGVRWYSIAGPIRVDLAQALDIDGRPWRIHLTIGTPLL